jgi:hypothetical protein
VILLGGEFAQVCLDLYLSWSGGYAAVCGLFLDNVVCRATFEVLADKLDFINKFIGACLDRRAGDKGTDLALSQLTISTRRAMVWRGAEEARR